MGKGHKDKVAAITGAASGIGQAFAQRLAEEGVHVAVVDRQPGDETVKRVVEAGRESLFCECDVASPESVDAMARQVLQRFGSCDIVINCAGVFPLKPFEEITYDDWRRVLSVNLDGTFLTCAAFAPGMKSRGWGRIVNMASSTFGGVVTGFAHYVASKGGVIGLTRALATELGPYGVTVNSIAPGLTRTPGAFMRGPRAGVASMEEEFERTANMQAIKRGEVPADLVGTISFLTSDDAAFITGQMINVDGGRNRS
jgi:NAD(P)-dependent dehydrogenase (short-subunit alcohol dehydrogenase family)